MQFDLTLPLLLLLAVGMATCGRTAEAQTLPEINSPAPVDTSLVEPADPTGVVDIATYAAQIERAAARAESRADSLATIREANAQTQRQQALADSMLAIEMSRPVAYATGYGLQVVLPPGWDGPVLAEESGFPAYAFYSFDNARLDRSIPGARVRIERVASLNPLDQERWRLGQSPYGLHGLRPVAALDVSMLPIAAQSAIAVGADGVRGITVYAQRGTVYWAAQVSVPEAVYAADPSVLNDLLLGLTLP